MADVIWPQDLSQQQVRAPNLLTACSTEQKAAALWSAFACAIGAIQASQAVHALQACLCVSVSADVTFQGLSSHIC